jgi:ArsR family transcriptional regulator
MVDSPDGLAENLDTRACKLVAEFFSVYANPTRINIFCALRGGRKTVSELAEHANVSLQNISQHLRVIRDKGAVYTEKEGQRVYYSISDPRYIGGVKLIHDALVDDLYRRVGSVEAPAINGQR